MSEAKTRLEDLMTELTKEFLSRFTHDWPPELYTKKEKPEIVNHILVFLRQSFEKVAKETAKVTEVKVEEYEDEWRCPLCQVKQDGIWVVKLRECRWCKDGWIEPGGRVALRLLKRRQNRKLREFFGADSKSLQDWKCRKR